MNILIYFVSGLFFAFAVWIIVILSMSIAVFFADSMAGTEEEKWKG